MINTTDTENNCEESREEKGRLKEHLHLDSIQKLDKNHSNSGMISNNANENETVLSSSYESSSQKLSAIKICTESSTDNAHLSAVDNAHVSAVDNAHLSAVDNAHLSAVDKAHVSAVDNAHLSAVKAIKDANKNTEMLKDSEDSIETVSSVIHNDNLQSNGNIVGTISNCINDNTTTSNKEQIVAINSCEPNAQNLLIMEICKESSIDNEQTSAIRTCDKDIDDSTDKSGKQLATVPSGVVNENVVSGELTPQEVKQSNMQSETLLNYDLSNRVHRLNSNHNSHEENACSLSVNINSTANNFEMIIEDPLLGCSPAPQSLNKSTDISLSTADDSIVISNSNAVPQSDNIVSSNYSLAQLRNYDTDESVNDDSHDVANSYRETNNIVDLCDKDSDSDSSSTSSSSSIVISDSSDSESDGEFETNTTKPKPIKAKGELDLDDLPPIEDLKISVQEEDCTPVGHVFQIVDKQVVIQAFKDRPALNLDTVLFLQEGKPFGKIFDVFGPVTEPYYCVRFNSSDHIKEKNVSLNQTIYCAPNSKYTNYVFMAQLLQLKGSDASWTNDLEPPERFLDYSDDEQEQLAKKKAYQNKKSTETKQHVDPDEPARKKHFSYEKKMNKRNLMLSALRRKFDINKIGNSISGPSKSSTSVAARSYNTADAQYHTFGTPPVFTARVPPGNVGYFSPRADMPPSNYNMFETRPDIFPPRSNMFPPRPDINPPRIDTFQTRPHMHPSVPNMFSPRSDMHPPRFNMFPQRTDVHPPRPDMFPPRPDMFPPRPDMFPPRPDMFHPRPDMFPPRPDMFHPRPDMFPPRPDMFLPRPDMFSPRRGMFPPATPATASGPMIFPGSNNVMHSPINSFQPQPLRGPDPHCPQSLQTRASPGPMNGSHCYSPVVPLTFHDAGNSQVLRQPYPNHPLPSNLWLQRPSYSSHSSPPPGFWPTPQPNSTTHMPHTSPSSHF